MHDLVERTKSIDPFHENLVIVGLCYEDVVVAAGADLLIMGCVL
jgi:hypothetical protein